MPLPIHIIHVLTMAPYFIIILGMLLFLCMSMVYGGLVTLPHIIARIIGPCTNIGLILICQWVNSPLRGGWSPDFMLFHFQQSYLHCISTTLNCPSAHTRLVGLTVVGWLLLFKHSPHLLLSVGNLCYHHDQHCII